MLRTLLAALKRLVPEQTRNRIKHALQSAKNERRASSVQYPDRAAANAEQRHQNQEVIARYIASDSTTPFPTPANPEFSIVVIWNGDTPIPLSWLLQVQLSDHSFEVLLAGSSPQLRELAKRFPGVVLVESDTHNFTKSANLAAAKARGEYLLFVHDNFEVLDGSIAAAHDVLQRNRRAGVVGGKLRHANGELCSAGGIVWQNATLGEYQPGPSPLEPAAMFTRPVDWCAPNFLLTRRELFTTTGGFDERYETSRYAAADYCLRLGAAGFVSYYEPRIDVVVGATPEPGEAADADAFVHRHRALLSSQEARATDNPLVARLAETTEHILFIEDRVPHPALGAGYPRSNRIVHALVEAGYFVTLYSLIVPDEAWSDVYDDIPHEVEVMVGSGEFDLHRFLAQRPNYYAAAFVCRPHNMATIRTKLGNTDGTLRGIPIIYDAEALFSLREIARLQVQGEKLTEAEKQQMVRLEVKMTANCHAVVAVSEAEAELFRKHGAQNVHTLGHTIEPLPAPNSFTDRNGLLFVGAMREPSPNTDSVLWFCREVLPLIDVPLVLAGEVGMAKIAALASDAIRVLGKVDDLTELYNQSRIFIAPTRFAAGIPIKIYEAAAHGLPVVATSLLAGQLGWNDGVELLVADDAATFAAQCQRLYTDEALWRSLRENALRRIESECSSAAFRERLKAVLP